MKYAVFVLIGLALLLLASWIAGRVISARMQTNHPAIGTFLDVNGRRVHVFDRGPKTDKPGRNLVMIHGASGNLGDMVFAFDKRLSADVRLLAVDRPGQGYTERMDLRGDASLDVQAKMIADTMAISGIRKAVIVAHSLGGALALRLALNHPDRVEGLVLIAPVSHPWPGGIAWYYRVASLQVIGGIFSSTIVPLAGSLTIDDTIRGIFSPAEAPADFSKAIGAGLILRPLSFQTNAIDVASLLDQVRQQSTDYARITVPVLIFTADTDTVVSPVIHSAALSAQLPDARLIRIEGAGHSPHHTKPDIVIAAMRDFLETRIAVAHAQN